MPLDDELRSAAPQEIAAPIDNAELMWASASYIFWPVLPGPLLLTAKREQPFLRFHFVQSLVFGFLMTVASTIFTVVIYYFYRGAGTPNDIAGGVFYVVLFSGWLLGMMFCCAWFLIFAWRAGQGHVFKILIIGPLIESWVLNSLPVLD